MGAAIPVYIKATKALTQRAAVKTLDPEKYIVITKAKRVVSRRGAGNAEKDRDLG
jgi:hypothetical protein